MRIVVGFFILFAVVVIALGNPEISNMVSTLDNSLKAALCTAIVAVSVVVFSQWRFDERQREQHEHNLKTKEYERKQDKAEKIHLLSQDVESEFRLLHFQLVKSGSKELKALNIKEREIQFNIFFESGHKITENCSQIVTLIKIYFPKIDTKPMESTNFQYDDILEGVVESLETEKTDLLSKKTDTISLAFKKLQNEVKRDVTAFWDKSN
ncbi:hypothetical protein FM038_014090 [Shewanella eurypsychrophilus]|uniref:Uncharacterized protein n=1 Tax=Shewanella eurypsychrophilus TaxID=2593656 RepID=A0ABX6V9D2_9GAMM|nr:MULTISPECIES: hypothetical protein [Shewanella]QFU23165.1 hypothetical protein FS418_15670 [Shewanella sp. YLB-09]QPG58448.1 hypothetical protein FM038_014090 [Shewanella eurypsychrophilus]